MSALGHAEGKSLSPYPSDGESTFEGLQAEQAARLTYAERIENLYVAAGDGKPAHDAVLGVALAADTEVARLRALLAKIVDEPGKVSDADIVRALVLPEESRHAAPGRTLQGRWYECQMYHVKPENVAVMMAEADAEVRRMRARANRARAVMELILSDLPDVHPATVQAICAWIAGNEPEAPAFPAEEMRLLIEFVRKFNRSPFNGEATHEPHIRRSAAIEAIETWMGPALTEEAEPK